MTAKKTRTVDDIQAEIQAKKDQIAKLEKEIKDLEGEGIDAAKAIAKQFGYKVVKDNGEKPKKATVEDITKWLVETINKHGGEIEKKKLVELFKQDDMGQRLKADKYVKDGVIVVSDDDKVTLGK